MRNKKLVNESMGAKPKERSKTGIARKLAMGVPLVASASGVKGGRGANRAFGALTGVTAGKKGIKVDPLGVAMALPVGKLIIAAKALNAAGKSSKVAPLVARVAAKAIGGSTKAEKALEQLVLELRGESAARTFATANRSRILEEAPKAWKKITGPRGQIMRGSAARDSAESLFPRLPNNSVPGSSRTFDIYDDPYLTGNERVMGAAVSRGNGSIGEAAMPRIGSQLNTGFTAASRKMGTVVRQTGIPEASSIAMVKKTAAQFGQKVSGKEAKLISRLLRGRSAK
jgi:hypothetical protein